MRAIVAVLHMTPLRTFCVMTIERYGRKFCGRSARVAALLS
jgi:hypothetical protein